MGVSWSYVSKIEAGILNLSLGKILEIADYLNIEVDLLLITNSYIGYINVLFTNTFTPLFTTCLLYNKVIGKKIALFLIYKEVKWAK